MTYLPFEWKEKQSLTERLSRPFRQIVVLVDTLGSPEAVDFLHSDDAVTAVWSKSHDIGERSEVGVLVFSPGPAAPAHQRLTFDVPNTVWDDAVLEKLVVTEGGVSAESGLVFRNRRSEEIVIVSGANPFGLAVRAPFIRLSSSFSPEHPMSSYRRVPIGKNE